MSHASTFRWISPALLILATLPLAASDADRDGLDDRQEDHLLQQFRPRFLLSPTDCGGLPAAFEPNRADPVAIPAASAIYGQAFPVPGGIELHYYHLWERDCGRLSHPWDVEHVSVLIRSGKAVLWYAAAHQGTVCDAGHGARAGTLDAETRGATVWISHGKHASFFSETACALGCGGDRCRNSRELHYRRVVNIGEPGAPRNGALWTASAVWPLRAKMVPDFRPEVMAQLDRKGIVAVDPTLIPMQSVILGGNSAIGGMERAQLETGSALELSARHVKRALLKARAWTEQRMP